MADQEIIYDEPKLTNDNSSIIGFRLSYDVQEAFKIYRARLDRQYRGINKSYALNKLLRKALLNDIQHDEKTIKSSDITISPSKL